MGNPVNPLPFKTKGYLESTLQDRSLAGRWLSAGGPRWVTLIDEALFVVGAAVFLIGSYDFYPGLPFTRYVEGCELFIIGSAIFVGLSLFAAFEIFEDAKLAGEPPDVASLFEESMYIVGSSLFLVGTVLFTPPLDGATDAAVAAAEAARAADMGSSDPLLSVTWFGKTIDLVVQADGEPPEPTESAIAKGDILFVFGSILYSVAAFVSGLKAAGESTAGPGAALRRRTAVATASLYELGGVAFVVGTLGFVPAPVLSIASCPEGVTKLTSAGATLFVAGSAAYLIGSTLTLLVTASLTYDSFEDAWWDGTGRAPTYSGADEGADADEVAGTSLDFGAPIGLSTGRAEEAADDDGEGGSGLNTWTSNRGEEFYQSTPTYYDYIVSGDEDRRANYYEQLTSQSPLVSSESEEWERNAEGEWFDDGERDGAGDSEEDG